MLYLGAMFAGGDSGVRVATFFEKLSHFLHLLFKSDSSVQRRLSLRNWDNGMAFFTCCG